jgi:hypothetical protein
MLIQLVREGHRVGQRHDARYGLQWGNDCSGEQSAEGDHRIQNGRANRLCEARREHDACDQNTDQPRRSATKECTLRATPLRPQRWSPRNAKS